MEGQFVSRLLVGAVKQTLSTSVSLISELDSTTPRNLPKRIGTMRACMSVGFIIGPLCGGQLSYWHTSIPCLLSAFIFVVNSVIVLILLPKQKRKEEFTLYTGENNNSVWSSLNGIKQSFTNPTTRKVWDY